MAKKKYIITQNLDDRPTYMGQPLTIAKRLPNYYFELQDENGNVFLCGEEEMGLFNQPQQTDKSITGAGDVWNRMIKLMNNHPDEEVKKRGNILLNQYNTAGGKVIEKELDYMLTEYGY